MANLPLTLACKDYDRTQGILDGRVRAEGIDLTCLGLPAEECFFRMVRYREFDVAEMSLSSYTKSLFTADRPFVAIPVFLSRMFRHSAIYINTESGIRTPKDLIGKRVGVPEYQVTAAVWVRGILEDVYGVPVGSVPYYTGGVEHPGRADKLPLQLPPHIHVEHIGDTKTLSEMLEQGEIDALYAPRVPPAYARGARTVARLFPDFQTEESKYFTQTQIHPIMHVVVIRREIYEKYPWVARSLFKAFEEAKGIAYERLAYSAALNIMLPWINGLTEQVCGLMGADYWPYGVESNAHTLQTFLRYHHEQGLSPRLVSIQELFAQETFEAFKI